MNISILDPSRFNELPLPVLPNSLVVVAEDETGIKGMWAASQVVHIEPMWLSPDVKDGGFTGLRMLQTLLSLLATGDHKGYFALSNKPEIDDYLARLGLTQLDAKIWVGQNPLVEG